MTSQMTGEVYKPYIEGQRGGTSVTLSSVQSLVSDNFNAARLNGRM